MIKINEFAIKELKWDIRNLKILAELNGLNNSCYKIKYLDQLYFLRISDKPTSKEKEIIKLCSKENISPKLYYFSNSNSNLLSEYIPGKMPTEEEFSSPLFINKLCCKLKLLHKLECQKTFNPFAEIRNNLAICNKLNIELPSYLAELINKLAQIEEFCSKNIDLGLCHNDLNPSNLLLAYDDLYLIDYEFSGINDIFFDLATLSWMMTERGKELLLKAYFKNPANYHYKKLSAYLFVVKLWNASWSLLKSQNNISNYDYKKGAYLIFEDLHASL